MRRRLDQALVNRKLTASRSQADSYIKLGKVSVNGRTVNKAGFLVNEQDKLTIDINQQYVSRAALKLASVADQLELDFRGKVILDVGSSTGGFSDYALRSGAKKVIAVELGSDQLHHSLRSDPRIELHEKTDIRNFKTGHKIDMVVIDVSFVSLQTILPSIAKLCRAGTPIVAMVKPQFEAGQSLLRHHGVIKNDRLRRDILKSFETWASAHFVIVNKADSSVSGAKGNVERFYLLK